MPRAAPATSRAPSRAIAAGALAAGALVAGALLALALTPAEGRAQTVRSGTGATPAALTPLVDQFRADLGALNPNTPGSLGSGRREISWDGVPLALSSPNPFPGDFFNAPTPGRARGTVFTTPGTGFEVSSNAGEGGFEFENLNPTYPDQLQPFSAQKLFTAIASNTMDVRFFVPGTTTPAAVRGFGAVFADVDLPSTTSMSFYGLGGELLDTFFVEALNGGLSFLGASYADDVVTMVRITSGNVAPGPDDGPTSDVVVVDDFIYGEPVAVVPEPGTCLLIGSGLVGLAAVGHRRRQRG